MILNQQAVAVASAKLGITKEQLTAAVHAYYVYRAACNHFHALRVQERKEAQAKADAEYQASLCHCEQHDPTHDSESLRLVDAIHWELGKGKTYTHRVWWICATCGKEYHTLEETRAV